MKNYVLSLVNYILLCYVKRLFIIFYSFATYLIFMQFLLKCLREGTLNVRSQNDRSKL
jgi:hypothetical protein